MKQIFLTILILTGAMIFSASSEGGEEKAPYWNSNLSLSGGGFWTGRYDITITNKGNAALENYYLTLPITKEKGEDSLPLAGKKAESLRVCDLKGRELLFDIKGTDGLPFHRGTLTEGMSLVLLINCPKGESALCSVYFGNDNSWYLPDWLPSLGAFANKSFEKGNGKVPDGWAFDMEDDSHHLFWCNDISHSGKKCVKTIVDEKARSTWIAARQMNVSVKGGAKYRISAWVKGENVKGWAGWYIHLGNASNSMMAAPSLHAGAGTFDWKKVSTEITVPKEANLLSYGTVLYGTGTAWYDDVEIVLLNKPENTEVAIDISEPVRAEITHRYPKGKRDADGGFIPTGVSLPRGARYALLKVFNNTDEEITSTVRLNQSTLIARWNRKLAVGDFTLYDSENKALEIAEWNGNFFFEAKLQKKSCHYFLLVENTKQTFGSRSSHKFRTNETSLKKDSRSGSDAFPGTSQQAGLDGAFPGTSQQKNIAKADAAGRQPLPEFLQKRNLVVNGDMEAVGKSPEGWDHDATDPKDASFRIIDPKVPFLGRQALEMTVKEDAKTAWRGWRQAVPVKAGRKYFAGLWMSCDSKGGSYMLHLHYRKANKSLVDGGMGSLGPAIGGKTDWTLLSGNIASDPDTALIEFHLTTDQNGTVRHDGVFLIEMDTAEVCELSGGKNGIFQVPAIVKVFEDTTFPTGTFPLNESNPASVFAAGNERESLQIALRNERGSRFQIGVTPPVLTGDGAVKSLPVPEVFSVGNVPVDYPSGYYNTTEESPIRHLPKNLPGCDGWSGWWPDPLIPVKAVVLDAKNTGKDLPSVKILDEWKTKEYTNDSARLADLGKSGLSCAKANKTRALWLTFNIPKNATPGVYNGAVLLKDLGTRQTETIPYTVEVLNFSLPDEPACGAVYDVRGGRYFRKDKSADEVNREIFEFMTDSKLCADHVPASPVIKYDPKTGKTECDWTKFDEKASWYFNELGVKYAYTPGSFYLFGWGMPPRKNEGGEPYDGEYPYDKADRSVLRPEYKKAYQAKLKAFWDHVKEKGWDKKFVLYISDEPFYSREEIIKQMKALCDMIHEVDPAIPIYSSTWRYIPEWDGYINVWGIGHYGIVTIDQIEKIKANKGRIWWTTDGQMCLDTPYCAVERLLPYWCHFYGADVYEFWGATWYTYNPFEYGWHSYIPQSDTPGKKYYVRYPNGDGYILYPGNLIGLDGLVSSVRMEQARAGVEDAAWLAILQSAIEKASDQNGAKITEAKQLMKEVKELVPIPVAGGRYSTRFLTKPEQIDSLRYRVGKMIEAMKK